MDTSDVYTQRFKSALYALPPTVSQVLQKIPDSYKSLAEEIRLRTDKPLMLTVNGGSIFVSDNGQTRKNRGLQDYIVSETEVAQAYKSLCGGSVYSHTGELKEGYIILKHGHRAGICGTATEDGVMRDISSINIRIAKEVFGSADEIIQMYDGGGMLIAGPPGSGKTTILRDLIRQLSNGATGEYLRITAVDTRGELSATYAGRAYNDLGDNTDILLGVKKDKGISMAVRTLYPDIVAFDEVSEVSEAELIIESFNTGVSVITTAHIGNERELYMRDVTSTILKSGAVKTVILLSKNREDGLKIMSAERVRKLCGY